MNVEIGTEEGQFLFWEYLFKISGIVSFQCSLRWSVECRVHERAIAGCEGVEEG
jgi:hypothetical protein